MQKIETIYKKRAFYPVTDVQGLKENQHVDIMLDLPQVDQTEDEE